MMEEAMSADSAKCQQLAEKQEELQKLVATKKYAEAASLQTEIQMMKEAMSTDNTLSTQPEEKKKEKILSCQKAIVLHFSMLF